MNKGACVVEGMHKKTKQHTILGKIHSTIFIGQVKKKITMSLIFEFIYFGGC
jgi:hypothetical protein